LAKNSLSKILWDMAKRGDAFLLNTSRRTHVLVPYGKYAGLWTYQKSSKMCQWHFYFAADLAGLKAKAYGPSGKSRTFPLPDLFYSWVGTAHPGKLHAANRKMLGWAVSKWAAMIETRLKPLAEVVARINDHTGRLGGNANTGLRIAAAFNMPGTLACLEKNRQEFISKLEFIGRSSTFISHLSPARRQRFVSRALAGGPAAAVKKCFHGADGKQIAKVFADNTWKTESGFAYAFIASKTKSIEPALFESLLHMARNESTRKISKLEIHFIDEANNSGPNT